MATKTIPELTLISAVDDDCLFPTDDTIKTYRATAPQIYEYLKAKEKEVVQDYTLIKTVGESLQQMAGHIWDTDEGGAGTDIAYYKFHDSGSLVDDEEGAYGLTNNNAATATDGIMNDGDATQLVNASSQYYHQETLLDTMPTNGLLIDTWVKPSDGQPAGGRVICSKENVLGQDRLQLYLWTDGTIVFKTEENNNNEIQINSSTILPNTSTGWYYIAIGWDTTHGMRLWINGILEAQNSSANTLMDNGTGDHFYIGTRSGPADYWDGDICGLRVRDMLATQKDIDLAYATRYTTPTVYTDLDFIVQALLKTDGSDSFVNAVNWSDLEVARNDSYLYRNGGVFGSSDKLRLIAK